MSKPPKPSVSLSTDEPLTVADMNTRLVVEASAAEDTELELEVELPAISERYEVCRELARGGMGIVLACCDHVLAREVAVKLLLSKHRNDIHLRRRFVREARLLSRLQHPGVVPVYDMGEAPDGRPFFAMQLVEGRSLAQMLVDQSDPAAERGKSLKVLEQVCQALAYAHSRGVVHLDLKPSNIMIGKFGEVQVMDWGLARLIAGSELERCFQHAEEAPPAVDSPLRSYVREHSANVTVSDESVQGTPAYMSPEQALGKPVDARSDVFSIGAVLFEILTRRTLYQGNSVGEIYALAARGEVQENLAALSACQVDRPLIRLVQRCLAPKEERPKHAGMVADYLQAYLETALQTAESDLKRFFDLSVDLFCIANTDGYFLRVNDNFPRVLGHSKQELVVQPFIAFVHPDDRPKTLEVLKRMAVGEPVIRFRNRYRCADGSYRTLEWVAKTVTEEQIIFAVARDVSE